MVTPNAGRLLDGGERKEVKRLKVKVKPAALTVMVPAEAQ